MVDLQGTLLFKHKIQDYLYFFMPMPKVDEEEMVEVEDQVDTVVEEALQGQDKNPMKNPIKNLMKNHILMEKKPNTEHVIVLVTEHNTELFMVLQGQQDLMEVMDQVEGEVQMD
jgi:hypothetical protein